MACYHPIPARDDGPDNGAVTLWPPIGEANINIPCGKCLGCKAAKAAQWGQRSTHEASLWEHNVFLTLTYDDEHLPPNAHLVPRHLSLFIKRLRRAAQRARSKIATDRSHSIRLLACGEYGETTQRPHYHLILYNCGFQDAKRAGKDLYESDTIAELWTHGAGRVGEATTGAATYIAKYTLKKARADCDHDADGVWRPSPFLRMSLRPAIGLAWLQKNMNDLRNGYLVSRDAKQRGIPRYYRKKLLDLDPLLAEQAEGNQYAHRMNTPTDNNTPARLKDAEIIHQRREALSKNRTL